MLLASLLLLTSMLLLASMLLMAFLLCEASQLMLASLLIFSIPAVGILTVPGVAANAYSTVANVTTDDGIPTVADVHDGACSPATVKAQLLLEPPAIAGVHAVGSIPLVNTFLSSCCCWNAFWSP